MFNQLIYQINIVTLINWLLPTFLRKTIWIAWIQVFLNPIESLYSSKQLFRNSIRYKLRHSGHKIYLEKVLNEYYSIVGFDPTNHQATKQIYIGAGEDKSPMYLYQEIEQQPVHIYTQNEVDVDASKAQYLYTQQELDAVYADFIVWVPVSLSFIEAEVRAVIDYYLDIKIYKIKTY